MISRVLSEQHLIENCPDGPNVGFVVVLVSP